MIDNNPNTGATPAQESAAFIEAAHCIARQMQLCPASFQCLAVSLLAFIESQIVAEGLADRTIVEGGTMHNLQTLREHHHRMAALAKAGN